MEKTLVAAELEKIPTNREILAAENLKALSERIDRDSDLIYLDSNFGNKPLSIIRKGTLHRAGWPVDTVTMTSADGEISYEAIFTKGYLNPFDEALLHTIVHFHEKENTDSLYFKSTYEAIQILGLNPSTPTNQFLGSLVKMAGTMYDFKKFSIKDGTGDRMLSSILGLSYQYIKQSDSNVKHLGITLNDNFLKIFYTLSNTVSWNNRSNYYVPIPMKEIWALVKHPIAFRLFMLLSCWLNPSENKKKLNKSVFKRSGLLERKPSALAQTLTMNILNSDHTNISHDNFRKFKQQIFSNVALINAVTSLDVDVKYNGVKFIFTSK